jgi:N-methylhydantoinase A
MSLAVREVSVEKGYDPRDFAMVASGGAGPPHAVAIARELHIPTVIIPRFPAHFSAVGMLMTDERHDFIRTFYAPLKEADFKAVRKIYDELVAESAKMMTKGKKVDYQVLFDLRYVGQEFTLSVPVTMTQIEKGDRDGVRKAFDELHEQRYAHHAADEPLEIINVRLVALGRRAKMALPALNGTRGDAAPRRRKVYFDNDTAVDCPVYDRESLRPGQELAGPLLVSEYASTTVVFPGDKLKIAPTGEMIISVRSE